MTIWAGRQMVKRQMGKRHWLATDYVTALSTSVSSAWGNVTVDPWGRLDNVRKIGLSIERRLDRIMQPLNGRFHSAEPHDFQNIFWKGFYYENGAVHKHVRGLGRKGHFCGSGKCKFWHPWESHDSNFHRLQQRWLPEIRELSKRFHIWAKNRFQLKLGIPLMKTASE